MYRNTLSRRLVLVALALCATVFAAHAPVLATPLATKTSVDFVPSEALKPRVDFWVGIFARYGKDDAVIHHRDFPQIVFSVLNFSAEAKILGDGQLERYRKASIKKVTDELVAALKKLGEGRPPDSDLENRVVRLMSVIPGGKEKYLKNRSGSKSFAIGDLIRSQTGIREKFAESVRRSGRYLPTMERIFADYGLPIELTRLPFIESSFDYTAYSSVGAAGIWQFMRSTGRVYLTINNYVDERRDPVEASKAAARYLEFAYNRIGSWPLAVTSYNHGVNGVIKKVRELGTMNIAKIVEHPTRRIFGFASNNFYPELLAALEVSNNYKKYFPGLIIESPLLFDQIKLVNPVSVKFIGTQLGVSNEQLRRLNYGLSEAVWQGRYRVPAGYIVKVPPGAGLRAGRLRVPELGVRREESSPEQSGLSYRVRRGDTISSIAKRYKLSASELMEINGIRSSALKVGQLITVRQSKGGVRGGSEGSEKSSPSRRTYKVRKGDSLFSLAERNGTTVVKLKRANGLTTNVLKAGQVIVVE